MIVRCQVRADVPNSFAKKNGERVNERLLTMLDIGESPIADTFEAVDPHQAPGDASLAGRTGNLHVTELVARVQGVRLVGRFEADKPAGKPAGQ